MEIRERLVQPAQEMVRQAQGLAGGNAMPVHVLLAMAEFCPRLSCVQYPLQQLHITGDTIRPFLTRALVIDPIGRLEQAIAKAFDASVARNHGWIGVDDLLLGLLATGDLALEAFLASVGTTARQVSHAICAHLVTPAWPA